MDNLPPPVQITSNSSNPSGPSNLSKPSNDDPLFEAKINNPFSRFFKWLMAFVKKQSNITIKIPIVGVLIALSSLGTGAAAYKLGFNAALSTLFPDSSPVFHRAISVEGLIQKSSANKYYLKSGDNYTWALKPVNSAVKLADYINQQVQVKGNLTSEKSVIEVSDIIPFDLSAQNSPPSQTTLNTPYLPGSPNSPNPSIPSNPSLPVIYPGLSWETTQKRVLIFTSGKRKIEEEGVYLESSQLSSFPQEFINYYIEGLKAQSFKETLNSISPEGITITYAKGDLFLTFGVKNTYKGSGNNKQLIGYKAYLEYN